MVRGPWGGTRLRDSPSRPPQSRRNAGSRSPSPIPSVPVEGAADAIEGPGSGPWNPVRGGPRRRRRGGRSRGLHLPPGPVPEVHAHVGVERALVLENRTSRWRRVREPPTFASLPVISGKAAPIPSKAPHEARQARRGRTRSGAVASNQPLSCGPRVGEELPGLLREAVGVGHRGMIPARLRNRGGGARPPPGASLRPYSLRIAIVMSLPDEACCRSRRRPWVLAEVEARRLRPGGAREANSTTRSASPSPVLVRRGAPICRGSCPRRT